MKTLTVAIPAYNAEQYLGRCLKTLLIPKHAERLDVVIVNDGSTDGTHGIAEEYVRRFPDTYRLVDKENGGHGSAINVGIAQAQGRYFRVLDADDWVDTQGLEKLVSALEVTTVDLVSTHYHKVSLETGMPAPFREEDVEFGRVYAFEELDARKRYFTLASSCFKTAILKSRGIRIQEKTFYVDVEYILLPIPYVNTVLFLDLFVYKYAVDNEGQSINTLNMARRYDQHERVLKNVLDKLAATGVSGTRREYCDTILSHVAYTNYAIGFAFHPDRDAGRQLNREFDAWLKRAHPDFYAFVGRQYPQITLLRKADFNAAKLRQSGVWTALKRTRRMAARMRRLFLLK